MARTTTISLGAKAKEELAAIQESEGLTSTTATIRYCIKQTFKLSQAGNPKKPFSKGPSQAGL